MPATTKKELALRYFPDAATPRAATDRLMGWIKRCPELQADLKAAHYMERTKTLTPRQIAIITDYLGEP